MASTTARPIGRAEYMDIVTGSPERPFLQTKLELRDVSMAARDPAAERRNAAHATAIQGLRHFRERVTDPRSFSSLEALLESVESGAVAPLRGSWVVAQQKRFAHGRGEPLQRREDLP